MRHNFVISLAAISCESYAIKLGSEGFFDNLVQGAGAIASMTGNEDIINATNGIGNAATQMKDGNFEAGMTGALGSMGGVIPGQGGEVLTDLSTGVGSAVGSAVQGDFQGVVTNAAGGAA